jgi:ATP-binding cassette subfamily B protein
MKILSWRQIIQFLAPPIWPMVLGLVAILVAGITFLAFGLGMRYLIDHGFVDQNAHILDQALLFLGGIILLLSFASYVRYYALNWASESALIRLKSRLLSHLLQQDRHFYQNQSVGSLVSHFSQDMALVQANLSQAMPVLIRNSLLFGGAVLLLFWTSLKLAVLAFLMIPLILVPSLWIARKVKKLSQNVQNKQAGQTQFLIEVLSHIPFIQCVSKEKYFENAFDIQSKDNMDLIKKRLFLRSLLIMIVFTLVFGAIGLVLWYGGHEVLSQKLSPGDLSSFIFYAIIAASSLSIISENHQELQQVKLVLTQLSNLLKEESLIIRPQHPKLIQDVSPEIVFSNLSFAYPGNSNQALNEVSFTIKSGQKIGLVGASGSGKSTLFRLLLRLYNPTKGQILWNNVPIQDYDLEEYRSKIAYIPQDPVLFSASIRENLCLGEKVPEEKLMEATKMGQCYDFIQKLPQGFDTQIAATKGGIGIDLSGGERQRLALSRAFLQDPKLVLLDEVTNALDNQNDALIQKALHQLMKGRTSLVIAHKLTTIQAMDKILVLDHGNLVETGTHLDLLSLKGQYAKQYDGIA